MATRPTGHGRIGVVPMVVACAGGVLSVARLGVERLTDRPTASAALLLALVLLLNRQVSRRKGAVLHPAIDWALVTAIFLAINSLRQIALDQLPGGYYAHSPADVVLIASHIGTALAALAAGNRIIGPVIHDPATRRTAALFISSVAIVITSQSIATLPTLVLAEARAGSYVFVGVTCIGQMLWAGCLARLAGSLRNFRTLLPVHLAAHLHVTSVSYTALTTDQTVERITILVAVGLLATAALFDIRRTSGRGHRSRSRDERRLGIVVPTFAALAPATLWMYLYGRDVAWAAAILMALSIILVGLILLIRSNMQRPNEEIPVAPIDELCLEFQPIVRVTDGEIVGAEALLRVRDSSGRSHPAPHIVEHLGRDMSHDHVTDFVFRQTFRDGSSLLGAMDDPDAFVSLNLSPHEIVRPDLVRRIEQALEQCGCTTTGFAIELTEQGTLMASRAEFGRRLLELQDLGFLVILDDFGSGQANLASLGDFEFDVVKLDRSLLRSAASSRGERVLKRAIDMAASTGARVIVEGVETDDDLAIIRDNPLLFAQGYGLQRPSPVLDVLYELSPA